MCVCVCYRGEGRAACTPTGKSVCVCVSATEGRAAYTPTGKSVCVCVSATEGRGGPAYTPTGRSVCVCVCLLQRGGEGCIYTHRQVSVSVCAVVYMYSCLHVCIAVKFWEGTYIVVPIASVPMYVATLVLEHGRVAALTVYLHICTSIVQYESN